MSGEVEASQAELDMKALESFLVGNRDLERLEALLDRFNILEALGVVRQELRHSDFLRFLLDPRNPHGLGDSFVKRLLQRALMVAGDVPVPVTPIELELWDLGRVEVRREWQHIDILLLDEDHKLAVIVENKIWSGEHSDQLQRYYRIVEEHHPGWRIVAVYLTPNGDAPSHESYLPMDYGLVCEVMDGLAEDRASVVNPDVKTLMTHYTDMLRRNIVGVGDSEVARLSSRIYRRHRHAIELIYRHRFARQEAIRDVLIGLIESNSSLIYDNLNTIYPEEYVAFWPHEWDSPALSVARGWGKTGRILRFIFSNGPDDLNLMLQLGPGDEEVRNKVLNMAHEHPDVFGAAPGSLHRITSLWEKPILTPEQYEDAADTDLGDEIRRHWTDFLREDLPRIDAALRGESWIWESDEPQG